MTRIHHVSLITGDLPASIAFYVDVLDVSVDPARPDLGYPGAWLTVADQQIHLLALPNPDPVEGRPAHVGRDRHVAFSVASIADIEARLEAKGIPFTRSRSGRRALFCRDPDGKCSGAGITVTLQTRMVTCGKWRTIRSFGLVRMMMQHEQFA